MPICLRPMVKGRRPPEKERCHCLNLLLIGRLLVMVELAVSVPAARLAAE